MTDEAGVSPPDFRDYRAAGLAMSLGTARLMSSLLYRVPPHDLATLISVCVLLAGIAALASYIPARRAAKVDPMVALRYE